MLLSVHAYAGEYNLLEIYNMAKEKSYAIKISELRMLESDKDRDAAFGGMLPRADMALSEQQVNSFLTAQDGVTEERDRKLETEIIVSQPLYNPEIYKTWKIACMRSKISELGKELSSQVLIITVINQYFQLLKNHNSLEIMQTRVKMYEELHQTAIEKHENGLGTLTDISIAKKELQLSRIQENNIKQNIRLRNDRLNILTRAQITGIARLQKHQPVIDKLLTLDHNWEYLIKNNIELKVKHIEADIKEMEISRLKMSCVPTLDLSYTYENTDVPHLEEEKTIALNLTWPVFSGFSVFNSIKKERYAHEILLLQKKQKKEELETEIKSSCLQAIAARKNYFDYQDIFKTADSILKDILTLHKKGRKTLTDVTDAEKDRTEALLNINNSLIDFILSRSTLYYLCGKIDSYKLKALNRFLIP